MFKTENRWETPQVVDATDGSRYTRKRGLGTLNKMLSLRTLKRTTLKRTLSLRTLKKILKDEEGSLVGVSQCWKDASVGAGYMIFLIETLFNLIHF